MRLAHKVYGCNRAPGYTRSSAGRNWSCGSRIGRRAGDTKLRLERGVDLISEALPFGRLWYGEPNAVSNAIDYAKFYSRSHDAVIRVYDEAGNVIETHEHAGDFKDW